MAKKSETERLRTALTKLHGKERLEGAGAILTEPRGYLSFSPYMLSSDVGRAYRFKNIVQARKLVDKFPELLAKFKPVRMSRA